MVAIVISLIIIIAVLLILTVLVQDSKGGGVTSQFSASQVMGVKKTGDLLEKLTWGFAIAIIVLTIGTSFMFKSSEEQEETIETPAAVQPTAPAQAPAPSQPAAPAK